MNFRIRCMIAGFCVLGATPAAIISLPWSIATARTLFEQLTHLQRSGTEEYLADRNAQLVRYCVAMILYLSGFVAYWGLIGIAFNRIRRNGELIVWICAMLTGFGMAAYNWDSVIPNTDISYAAVVIYVPISIGILSTIALILWLAENRAEPCNARRL